MTHLGADTPTGRPTSSPLAWPAPGSPPCTGTSRTPPPRSRPAPPRRLGVPYGFSVHALDARKVSTDELAARAAGASVVLACNADAAETVAATGVRPRLLPHGVDLDAFPATSPPASEPTQLLAVGRFVAKKGFATLLAAVARVERPLHLRLVGDGPLRAALVDDVRRLGLDARVTVEARRAHDSLPACYAAADVVVVPSVVDASGDRDGLPNVVLEAMASGRPVVASDVGAIATGVRDGVTGRLVPPDDRDALAAAITELVDRPDLRRALGVRAREVAERDFALADCTAAFCATLEAIHA